MDVLIVAGLDDGVALRLRQALEKRGRRVSHHDGPSAARLFTLRVAAGTRKVTPSSPMFVRASAWWHEPRSESSDERFLRAEAYATFWAAAALSPAPVINRPGRDGSVGRMTSGALAALSGSPPGASRPESYVSGPEVLGDAAEAMWGEDLEFRVAPVAQFRRGTPLRARELNPGALYEIVTVVGERGFSATQDPRSVELHLEERSAAITRRAAVHFATITWAVDDTGATPVRLNSAPEEFELRYHWNDVADTLCEDLTR
jgi:hypothetical protein